MLGVTVSTVFQEEVDMCGSNVLTAPEGNDAGYACPEAGAYNLHTGFQLWGNNTSWYADVYGYTMGLSVSIRDVEKGDDDEYATCSLNILVRPTTTTSSSNSAALLGLSAVGLTGLVSYLGFLGLRGRRASTSGDIKAEIESESREQHLLEMTDIPNEIVAAPNENYVLEGPSHLV
jgi:hypothetical protein